MKTKAESFRVLRIPKFVTDQSASRDSNELSSESLTDFPDRGFGTVKKVDSLRSYNSIFGPKNTPKKIGEVTSVQTGKVLLKNASMLISTRANTLDSTGIDDALKERPSLNTPSKQYFKITKNLKFNYLNPNGPLKVGLVKKETTQSTSALELPILSSKRDNLQSKSTKSPQSVRTPPPYLDYFPNLPSPTRPSAQPDYYLHCLYRHSQWQPSSASPKNPFSKYFDHMHE